MSKIEIRYIETVFDSFIKKLKQQDITELSFSSDNYWSVPLEFMDSFPTKPELTVGSLDDDINFLKSLVDDDYTTNYLELERLAALLRFISRMIS